MSTPPQLQDLLKTAHLHADLKDRSVRGGFLTLFSQGTQFVLQTISTIVLARLLTPTDFGIVAMVTAVTGFGKMFVDVGLTHATIQREDINEKQVSTLFWINAAVGLLLTLGTAALAPVLARFYGEERLVAITLAVSCTFIFSGLMAQHDALLKRQMRYRSLAIRDVVSLAIGVAVALALAWKGAGYWALVILPLSTNFTLMILSWFTVKWRPGLPSRTAEVRPLLVFGGNLVVSNIFNYLNRMADNILVGWYWGAGPLGLYSRAYNLLMLPLRQLNAPLATVAIPAFSRVQDPMLYAQYYLRTVNLLMWVNAPLIGFLFIAAEPVIVLVLGEQWRDAAIVFQVLAISSLAQPLLDTTGWLFISRGRTDRHLKLGLLTSPIIVGSFVIGLPFGIKGVALSYSLFLLAMLPWIFKFTFAGTELTLRSFGQALLPPVSVCLVAVLFSLTLKNLINPEGNLMQVLVLATGFGLAYSIAVLIPAVRAEVVALRDLFLFEWRALRGD